MKLFTKILGAAVASVALVGVASCGKDNDGVTTIYAETKGAPAPFIYQDSNGKLQGYDIAVINEVFDRLPQYKLNLKISDSALTDAQTGLIDFTINNWSYNADRAKSYYFSYPYTRAKYGIYSANGTSYSTFEEVAAAGKKVFGTVGLNTTNAIERYNEANPTNKITIEYTELDITAKLPYYISGEYVEIGDLPVLNSYAKSYPEQFAQLTLTTLSDEYVSSSITSSATSHLLFGKVNKNSDSLRKEISEKIKELHDDGTLLRLANEWVGVDITPSDSDYEHYLN